MTEAKTGHKIYRISMEKLMVPEGKEVLRNFKT